MRNLIIPPQLRDADNRTYGANARSTTEASTSGSGTLPVTLLPTYGDLKETVQAVILNKLPKKLGDPGRFLIPCEFTGITTCNALADLGASINLMPYSVWKDLALPELTPTCMTLELADRSITEPIGRCFLKNHHALIEVYEGELPLRDGKEANTFQSGQTSKYTADNNHMTVNKIDVMHMAFDEIQRGHPLLEAILKQRTTPQQYLPEVRKELKLCEAKTVEPSIDEPPEVELKELPPHLEYAFLEGDDKLPVIIAKDLKDEEKAALLKVLKSHKRAIAWKLSDIKGVSPEFCTHKILMEEDYEPSVQSQRRVNPKIHDVIKKEVEKLLELGLIFTPS
ncbi:reverse transcriptase domain-containing protein [Tanacetum coccineum]